MNNNQNLLVIPAVFIIGLWLVVIQPLGPQLSQLPGDLGDTRFNSYILEHNYRWISGNAPSLSDAPFFYPYPQTVTFSDSHWGSMLFYDLFRWSGLERESALQAWYILSFAAAFSASIFVLNKLKLNPLAAAAGAFFFTFGLPLLAQENHLQLSYRFCIPLAVYAFWRFLQKPRLKPLALTLFWLAWQFYLTIYLGFFLSLLLIAAAILSPFFYADSPKNRLLFWPRSLVQAWKETSGKNRAIFLLVSAALLIALFLLFQPHIETAAIYNFSRPEREISRMLPRIQSYLMADRSLIWQQISSSFTSIQSYRWEHQLFIGIAAGILLLIGFIWKFKSPHKNLTVFFLAAAAILILMMLSVGEHSLYTLIWKLPGFNSIRAVSRIILVLMWPIAMFIAVVFDSLIDQSREKPILVPIVVLLFSLMIAESVLYEHATFSIEESNHRLTALREQLPADLPKDAVLYFWSPQQEAWYINELDAMLLSQDLGLPVMNGYSGFFPGGYGEPSGSCADAVTRITKYMDFKNIEDPAFFANLQSRLVTVGPTECTWSDPLPKK